MEPTTINAAASAAAGPTTNPATPAPDNTLDQARDLLRQHFGYDTFRPGQEKLIAAITAGRDVVGVMPTGAGKSLCYQIPALLARLTDPRALTIVVSPLVALMKDQVSSLQQANIPAAFLNSSLDTSNYFRTIDNLASGVFALLYVAPERLSDERFITALTSVNVRLIAIDEAHCVSQWGQDFRPSYLEIPQLIAQIQGQPTVAAFTATATRRVTDDIIRLLGLRDPFRLTTSFDRPNLRFQVEQLSDQQKRSRLKGFIADRRDESGIIYCATRKQVDDVHRLLVDQGFLAARYHAGLPYAERSTNQRAFVCDDVRIMVATNAFGMGIDKPDVRYVVHFNMPSSLEAYYQEAGRAGRDGDAAECLLMWDDSDLATCRFFVEKDLENESLTADEEAAVRAARRRRLSAMAGYCLTAECLRDTILRYFGERRGAGVAAGEDDGAGAGAGANADVGANAGARTNCGNCSNCDGDIEAVDVTLTARSVMRCVHELRGRYGKSVVTDVLCGKSTKRVHELGLERARTFGAVTDPPGDVKTIIELLATGDYLQISEGKYPLVGLGPRAREAAEDGFRLHMKRRRQKTRRAGSSLWSRGASGGIGSNGREPIELIGEDERELFDRLRTLRKRLADEAGIAPYMVFTDASLRAMSRVQPQDEQQLLAINGVGPVKLERYGKLFLEEITK